MIFNTAGTAAGIEATVGQCRVFVMPGVPKEMKIMFERDVLPVLRDAGGGASIVSRTLHTFGLGESAVAEMLGDLMRRDWNPSVGTTVSNGIVSLRVNSRFSSVEEARRRLESTVAECRKRSVQCCVTHAGLVPSDTNVAEAVLSRQGERHETRNKRGRMEAPVVRTVDHNV